MFHTSSKHSHVCLLWFQGSLFPGMLKNKQTWPFGFILYIIYIYNIFFIYLSAKKSPQIQLFLLCITPSKHGSWPKNHSKPPHFQKKTCFSRKKSFQHITSIAATDLIRSILSQWFPVATGTLTQKLGHCQATDRLICLRQKRFQWRRSPSCETPNPMQVQWSILRRTPKAKLLQHSSYLGRSASCIQVWSCLQFCLFIIVMCFLSSVGNRGRADEPIQFAFLSKTSWGTSICQTPFRPFGGIRQEETMLIVVRFELWLTMS